MHLRLGFVLSISFHWKIVALLFEIEAVNLSAIPQGSITVMQMLAALSLMHADSQQAPCHKASAPQRESIR